MATVNGTSGNDTLNGTAGNDTINGGAGNDTLYGGTTTGPSATGTGDDVLDGGAGQNFLYGQDGNDILDVTQGVVAGSVFDGGDGTDTLRLSQFGGVLASTLFGLRNSFGFVSVTLNSVERVQFASQASAGITASVSYAQASAISELTGGSGIDTLLITVSGGGAFAIPSYTLTSWGAPTSALVGGDTVGLVATGTGNFTLNAASLASIQSLTGSTGNDTLNGSSGIDILAGGGGNDVLNGNDGDDVLRAVNTFNTQTGVRTSLTFAGSQFNGGNGFDYLWIGGEVEFAGTVSGIEGVYFAKAFAPTAPAPTGTDEAELVISGTLAASLPSNLTLNGTGTFHVQLASGETFNGANYISAPGSDVRVIVEGSNSGETIIGTSGTDLVDGSGGNDTISTLGGDDIISGGDGNDTIDGGAGNDTAYYGFSNAAVAVDLTITGQQNTGGAGSDTLINIENLAGSSFNDTLTGDGQDNILQGGLGNDTLDGGAGNDTASYAEAISGVTVNLSVTSAQNTVGAGIDTLISIENLIGSDFNDILTGDANANTLDGHDGNDILDGGAGADALIGGNGNDTYLIDQSDSVIEFENGGTDTVNINFNYILGANLENLILTGTSNWSGIGNDVANVIVGNTGSNFIAGGSGADILTGGGGADTFSGSASDLSGDTITDFGRDDKIIITDASISNFGFALVGNTLLFSGGSLTLANVPAGRLIATANPGGGVAITSDPHAVDHDFNGDGRSDVLWRNTSTGQLTDWLGQPNGGFVSNDASALNTVPTSWTVVGAGDYNGDGRSDVLWRNSSGQLTEWLGQANGGFVSNDANAGTTVPTSWSVVGSGDYNGDGRSDILWRNSSGALTEWLGQANGGFVSNDANAGTTVPTSWSVVGSGDYNGDGQSDILWRNSSGALTEWLGQANGGFVSNDANALTTVPTSWAVVGSADFNGDGRADVLWRNSNGQLTDWLGRANGGFISNDSNALLSVGTDWSVVDTGDYNGDGRSDILWRNVNGQLTEWLGQANGGFVPNDSNTAVNIPTAWQVQPTALWL